MDKSTQGKATPPGSSQVSNINTMVTTSLFLTPSQQLIGLREGFCEKRQKEREDQSDEILRAFLNRISNRKLDILHQLLGALLLFPEDS